MKPKRTSGSKGSRKTSSKKSPSKKAPKRKAPKKKKPAAAPAPLPSVVELGQGVFSVGEEAVRRATGKGWDEWLAILDEAGARAMDHPTIARLLNEAHKLPGWWAQTVTVGYERARGMREVHQTSRGFEASRSKTIAASAKDVFDAWTDGRKRARWLKDPDVAIRASTLGRSLRMTWIDAKSSVEVWLEPKGESKTQVQVQHSKLVNASDVERKKAYWGKQLERLKELLER